MDQALKCSFMQIFKNSQDEEGRGGGGHSKTAVTVSRYGGI